jgi:hypothetical protein
LITACDLHQGQKRKCSEAPDFVHTLDACQIATHDQLLVLLADKLSNLQSIQDDLFLHGDTLWDHFNADRTDIAWYYLALETVFRARLSDTRMVRLYGRLMKEVFN